MDGLLLKDKVFDQLKMKGPQLPVHLAAQLKINLIFAGAFLSELIAEGKVKYTTLKVGGSPLYYAPGHEIRLQSFVKYLGQREKEAYDLLAQNKLLRDDELTPVIRVAMRTIKDFAVPLRITTEHEAAIYWKWYLLGEEEMHALLETLLANPAPVPEEVSPLFVKEETISTPPSLSLIQPTKDPEKKKPLKEITQQFPVTEKPMPEAHPVQQPLQEVLSREKEYTEKEEDIFAQELFAHFAAKGIYVLSHNIKKKNAEVECIVTLPTPFGEVSYLCLAKKKRRCSEADISAGYVKATAQRLPYLFISTSDLPKKVQEFATSHMQHTLVRTIYL